MRKIILLMLILIISISICGCNTVNDDTDDTLKIVTTIFPAYDFAKQICGDNATVTLLLKPGTESHTYDPSTQDILAIKNSDIFIYNGGESESWTDDIISSIATDKTSVISMMDVTESKISQTYDSHEHNDEHVWTSPKIAIDIVNKIYDTICIKDSDNCDFYKNNTEKFIKQLDQLDKEFSTISSNKPLIIGDRFPFSYLIEEYDFQYYSAFEDCSEESEPGAKTIANMIEKVKEHKIDTVFYIEFSNEKIADTICESTGAKKLLLHSCHNVSKDDFNSGVTYLELMQKNLINIKEALE